LADKWDADRIRAVDQQFVDPVEVHQAAPHARTYAEQT
jgi:hypothetical protein